MILVMVGLGEVEEFVGQRATELVQTLVAPEDWRVESF
jgi:hypothetical protein